MDKIKEEKYDMLYRQIASLIDGESNATGILANVSAAIHTTMDFWWTGFYLVSNGELQLGPFQGPVACMHIQYGRGVCGTTWKEKQTIVVGDVEQFPGHIACSSLSRSEIVVPIYNKVGEVVGVLDIDSKELDTFDDTDKMWLEKITSLVSRQLY